MLDNEEVGMKITLDRGSCSCCIPACEALFGWHFLGKEITPADCTSEMLEDKENEIAFLSTVRGGLRRCW